jgi:hypothetical protein
MALYPEAIECKFRMLFQPQWNILNANPAVSRSQELIIHPFIRPNTNTSPSLPLPTSSPHSSHLEARRQLFCRKPSKPRSVNSRTTSYVQAQTHSYRPCLVVALTGPKDPVFDSDFSIRLRKTRQNRGQIVGPDLRTHT